MGFNLYGYAGGDPVNRSDPFGLLPDTIEVQSHQVVGDMEHASVRVTPADQARWCNDSRFATGVDGKCFVTFGAGPERCLASALCLKSATNRPGDAIPHTGNIGIDLGGVPENVVIARLFALDGAYADNLHYSLPPIGAGDQNSNSYAAGLLGAAGLAVPALTRNPGWNRPLAPSRFGITW